MLNTRLEDFGRRYHFAPISIVVAVSLLAAIPMFLFGIPYGMDAAEHLSWYRCFVAQLSTGELYPRWLQGMNGGLGSPDLFVYGPLPYYAAAAFHAFTGPGREVYDLGLSIVAALILAGVAAYFWLRQLAGGTLVPTLGALVYLAVPYFLKTDLYTRCALAEFWAFAWMPLILCFTAVLLERRTLAVGAGLAVCWGLLFTTHLFTAMLFAPLPLFYAAWQARPRQRAASLLAVLAGMLLGFALAAFYLLPALSYQKYISAYKLIETRPDYRFERNFLFSGVAPTPYLKSLSRFTAWTAAVAALFGAAALMAKSVRVRREAWCWGIVAVCSLLLMLPVSGWFWTHLPLLGAIQFPSRLNTLLTVATAALAVAGMESLRQHWRWTEAVLVGLALLLAAGWIPPLIVTLGYQHVQVQQIAPMNLDYLITAWAQWTDPKLVSVRGIPVDPGASKVAPTSGTAVARRWDPRFIEFHTDSPSETWVTVKQFYFPGWTADLGQGRPLPLRPSSPEGLMEVQVPAGAADVSLRMADGMPEIAGAVLSALTAIGLILSLWYWGSRGRKQGDLNPREGNR
jgi:uncharacterized membrane protein